MNLRSYVKKKYFFFIFLFLTWVGLYAQKNAQIWEELLNNNRAESLRLVDKLDTSNDIENLILKKIVLMENGISATDSEIISKISSYPNFEPYLFSNWMMPYFFENYIENGFSLSTLNLPHLINPNSISNSTVKNGLYYLQAVTRLIQKKWDENIDLINNINSIKDWEFCGVFENLNSSGIDMPYDPENIVSDQIVFNAQSNGDAKWYKSPIDNEVYKFFVNHEEYGSGVHYAQTFINSPSDQRVYFKLGKGGSIRLWLNDVLILEEDDQYITELDAYTYAVNLQKGVNRILIKSATIEKAPYFILRLEDLNGNPMNDLKVSFNDRDYIKGSLESINPEFIPHSVQLYFENKLKDSNYDINLSRYCLFQTYLRNGKLDSAIDLLNSWSLKYPNSSFIASNLIRCFTIMNEETETKKLQNNLSRKDPDYYISLVQEIQDFEELMKLDIETYNSKLEKIKNCVDYPYIKATVDLLISLRENNREKLRQKLDVLLIDKTLPSKIKPSFSEFYSTVFNDDNATISTLEGFNKLEYNWEIIRYLAYYYRKQNRVEDAIEIYKNSSDKFNYDNNVLYALITLLHDLGQFEHSLPYINQALENFPNSYLFTKLKGDSYIQLNKKEEAINLYEIALNRNPSDHELRVKFNDLKNHKNPLNEFHSNNLYDYIEQNRNTIETNNYGLNILLNQTDILGYKNGGGEYRTTLIYEVTSQNGIEIFKEYDLELAGNYLIRKSEIVKPSGETVPADRNAAILVFKELEIGDVIYIDYEDQYTRNGRFYKDYILSHGFEGYHPTIKNIYRFITHDKDVNHVVKNGKVEYKILKRGDLFVHEWSLNNAMGIPISEDYMPPFNDVVTKLHISSIQSWTEIANWYSDIVSKQLKLDETVEEVFKQLFPSGYDKYSETERAEKIYYYITDNLNYSFVNFRQGGFVPQKPSKTIKTKLGDCKDFSSLFLVLAKKANLETNLVLVLTSDYGKYDLVLPSSDFNHCIVKVKVDGKEQYLELTDKNLPFQTLPISLRNATVLEIPNKSSDGLNSNLTYLNEASRKPAKFRSDYVMELGKESSNIELSSIVSGHLASYYVDVFQNKKDKLLEDEVAGEISKRSSENVELISIDDHNYDRNKGEIKFRTKLSSDLKVTKVGNVFTLKIPYFLNPYNESIIQNQNRSYPIDYKQYENSDFYEENILIKLDVDQKVVDLPENVNYEFRDHQFKINYTLIEPNEIKINIFSKVSTKDISTTEYLEFKSYVRKVLDTRDTVIKFQI